MILAVWVGGGRGRSLHLTPESPNKKHSMRYHTEHVYLTRYLLELRKRTNGYETPIQVTFDTLDKKYIPSPDFLNKLLIELKGELVPVEGESTRRPVIDGVENGGDGKFVILGSSKEKLDNFLKKIGVMSRADSGKTLPPVNMPNAVSWDRLRLVVNERYEVYAFYKDESGSGGTGNKLDFQDMGMKGRRVGIPGKLWGEFVNLAKKNGDYTYTPTYEDSARKTKETLAKCLRRRFDLSEDPFQKIEDRSYKTKFDFSYRENFPPLRHI